MKATNLVNSNNSLLPVESKHCLNLRCKKQIEGGRSDKKFCDDVCRGIYNNELKGPANNSVRYINNALSRNRRILESFLKKDESNIKIDRAKLVKKGFQFDYHTEQTPAKNGGTYIYCYEYGYLAIENDFILIIRNIVT
ncbi:MAG: hypothetical protein ACKVOM_02535 [Ferruginibacter sp.]